MISNEPKRSVPHREPFLWVTRLMERNETGSSGMVELDVNPEWDVFKGHFPNNPIFPGVLQMEAAAQACLWVNMGVLPEGKQPPDVLFVAVDSYKFRKPVVPPCTLQIRCLERASRSRLYLWEVEVASQGQIMSKGSFWMQKTDRN